jgi:3-methyladenine DNA glycosylase/8-oxoguanine DNA glycosylase
MEMLATVYRPSSPISLRQTLAPLMRGAWDPTHRWVGADLWRTTNTADGPATLRLVQLGDEIHAQAWGPGADRAIAGVPELCGDGDDWSELDLSPHPYLREILRGMPGLRLTRTNAVFEALLAAIIEQKVTSIEARHSWRVLLTKFGAQAPGPAPQGMRVFPTAQIWRRIPSWEWHRAGVTPQRSDTAMRAAAVADSLERTVAAKIRTVLGVGVWTAAETTQRSHGDPDSPSVGDYHLPSIVGYALAGGPVDDDGMLELLAPYAGHRQRVMRLIEATGIRAPQRGPRMTIPAHRSR